MKNRKHYLEKLRSIERKKYHPLIHKVHKKYRISKKTLFYIKEYGPHANVVRTIMKESIKILLLASIISSIGGLALEHLKVVFVSIIPMIILLPALNDMIGDFGTIISSRFSTLLHEGKAKRKWWTIPELRNLFKQIFIIAIITTIINSTIALVSSNFYGYSPSPIITSKIFFITIIDIILLVIILFLIAILLGFYFYKKKEDPNNFLIPITTSVADFGNMIILSILIILFF